VILHRCGASVVGAADGVDAAPIVDVVDGVDAVVVVGAAPRVDVEDRVDAADVADATLGVDVEDRVNVMVAAMFSPRVREPPSVGTEGLRSEAVMMKLTGG